MSMSDDGLNRVRETQNNFEQAMHDWVAARCDQILEAGNATVVTDFVLVARHRGFDSDGDAFGFTAVHDPIGQETNISLALVRRACEGLRLEEESDLSDVYDQDDDD